jgi:hypothetical protein
MGSAALAGIPGYDVSEVGSPEANHGQCFPCQRGEDQLALLSVIHCFTRLGIDDLNDVLIFPDVQAVMSRTP